MAKKSKSPRYFFVKQHDVGHSRLVPLSKAVPKDWELLKIVVIEKGPNHVVLKIFRVQ